MFKKKKAIILSCIWLMICLITLYSFSYAWIKRDWSPSVKQDGITITTTSALAIRIDGDDGGDSAVELVKVLNVPNISLLQVSNATGRSEDFFRVESDGNIVNAIIKHIDPPATHNNEASLEYGYVEIRFLITGKSAGGENLRQNIFLTGTTYERETDENGLSKVVMNEDGTPKVSDEGSYLRIPQFDFTGYTEEEIQRILARYQKLLNSIRVSITTEGFDDFGEDTSLYKTVGFMGGEHEDGFTHTGITNQQNGGYYIAENQRLYDQVTQLPNPDWILSYDYGKPDDQRVFHDFEDFINGKELTNEVLVNGVVTQEPVVVNGQTYYEASKTPLISIKPNTSHYITLRVWLEGTDPGCIEEIAGLKFDLNLRFDSEVIDTSAQN